MIQEKDFLYRVPVKTAPITTPKGQIRNPEILVDLEGGEFMHGNILDANSTNKLINQSVKEAVDNKIIEGGEDLSAKIKAEQTRAESKEKEISDKLAIVDGDSNTEGSFRKAIADVIAAAPEDLDTLKEIADKLADSDDLHTALNQAITEKADASALANEVTRATGAESNLQAAIDAKQDAGNYIPYDSTDESNYDIDRTIKISGKSGDNLHLSTNGININDGTYKTEISNAYGFRAVKLDNTETATFGSGSCIILKCGDQNTLSLNYGGLHCKVSDQDRINIDQQSINQITSGGYALSIDPTKIKQVADNYTFDVNRNDGIKWCAGVGDNIPYAKMDLYGLDFTTNDSTYARCNYMIGLDIKYGGPRSGSQTSLNYEQLLMKSGDSQVMLKPDRILVQKEGVDSIFDWNLSHLRLGPNGRNVKIGPNILSNGGAGMLIDEGYSIATYLQAGELNLAGSSGFNTKYCYDKIQSFSSIISFSENLIRGFEIETPGITGTISSAIEDIRSTKQDKITVNSVDVTDIETDDITKLRTIVKDLIDALSESGLIRKNKNLE